MRSETPDAQRQRLITKSEGHIGRRPLWGRERLRENERRGEIANENAMHILRVIEGRPCG
jgi:hypothetical protein